MKVALPFRRRVRIEMLPLIDIVFLLLVFFIYAMLSMAVHRALPVILPQSSTARIDKELLVSITLRSDGSLFVDKAPVPLSALAETLKERIRGNKEASALLFADRRISYQELFRVLDEIRKAGVERLSLQAEAPSGP